MSTSDRILFDIPRKEPGGCWSLNSWKVRMCLAFKGVEYKTQWVEFPSIEPTFKAFGIAPHIENSPESSGHAYTVPALRHGRRGEYHYVMESKAIARALEKRFPEPSLYLDSPALAQVEAQMPKLWTPLIPLLINALPSRLLNPVSRRYYEENRSSREGVPLDQLEKERGGPGGKISYDAALEPLRRLDELLTETTGPFMLGDHASYADFMIIGFVEYARLCREELFTYLTANSPALLVLYNASAKWLEKND